MYGYGGYYDYEDDYYWQKSVKQWTKFFFWMFVLFTAGIVYLIRHWWLLPILFGFCLIFVWPPLGFFVATLAAPLASFYLLVRIYQPRKRRKWLNRSVSSGKLMDKYGMFDSQSVDQRLRFIAPQRYGTARVHARSDHGPLFELLREHPVATAFAVLTALSGIFCVVSSVVFGDYTMGFHSDTTQAPPDFSPVPFVAYFAAFIPLFLTTLIIIKAHWGDWARVLNGYLAERAVSRALRRSGSTSHVFNDVLINHPWKSGKLPQVDHIVVGTFGVAVIETKHWMTALTVDGDDGWYALDFGANKWVQRESPVEQNAGHVQAVADELRKAGINVPVLNVLMVESGPVDLQSYPTVPVLGSPKQLRRYLQALPARVSQDVVEAAATALQQVVAPAATARATFATPAADVQA